MNFLGSTSNPNDIGLYINRKCSDEEKYRLLKNRWIPSENFKFPVSTNRNLKFQRKWLQDFFWLSYSEFHDGAFCQYCVLFGSKDVGKGGNVGVNSLAQSPFNRWKNAKEQFNYHQNLQYHTNAIVTSPFTFVDVFDKKIVDISLQLDKGRKIEIEVNRKILSSIIESIIFTGKQDIALRGHRDSGPISLQTPIENDGNFRALLRFRMAAGDDILAKHLETSTITWASPRIQNELIEICGNIILNQIIAKIQKAEYFSILADGTTDIGFAIPTIFAVCSVY